MAGENAAANAICSICYEDLKPVAENPQSISACGHVFHELCLQQWFEYCPNTNKRNCPICKQKCYLKDPIRLYFQSSGNQIEPQKVVGIEEDPVVLRGEVPQCRKQLDEDRIKMWEAGNEISTNKHLLKLKSEECVQLTSQCAQLQDRTMALAKELASLKLWDYYLVSDLSLEEDDVLKLALLGNNAKTKDTIDTLVKSLVIRNRSYKELLAKCNQLGRGEARSSEKLEKAMEKIDKLKVVSLFMHRISSCFFLSSSCCPCSMGRSDDKEVSKPATESLDKISTPLGELEKNDGFTNHGSCLNGREDFLLGIRHSESTIKDVKGEDNNVQEKRDDPMIKDIKFNIREDSTPSVSPCINGAGDSWLSSGKNQNLRRWSKQGDRNEAPHSLGGSVSGKEDDLISVGPDGKGGRVKVLRSKPQFSHANASAGSGKRFKIGAKTSGSSSQECLRHIKPGTHLLISLHFPKLLQEEEEEEAFW
ncbi:hypothetical protein Bca101_019198 [Brassica carinata]